MNAHVQAEVPCRSYNIVVKLADGEPPPDEHAIKGCAWEYVKRAVQSELGKFIAYEASIIERPQDSLHDSYIVRLTACPMLPGD